MLSLVWSVTARRLWMTVRGGSADNGLYIIAATPVVQLSLVLSVSLEDFYGPALIHNIATLLMVRQASCLCLL